MLGTTFQLYPFQIFQIQIKRPYVFDLENQLCVDREKYPLVPNSIYGNKELKGYEDAMRSISYNEVLARVESSLNH